MCSVPQLCIACRCQLGIAIRFQELFVGTAGKVEPKPSSPFSNATAIILQVSFSYDERKLISILATILDIPERNYQKPQMQHPDRSMIQSLKESVEVTI